MEANLNRNVNLNISQPTDLPEVPEATTAAQAVLKPLLARLSNLTVNAAPLDLEALMARLRNESDNAKTKSTKQYLGSVYEVVLARVRENGEISAQNMALLEKASELGKQVEEIEKQIAEQTAQLEELQKQIGDQTALITELEIKTAMLEKQVELVKSQQLTPAERRLAELRKKRIAEKDAKVQEELDRQIAEAEKDLQAAQANLTKAQGDLADAQGALATAQGNLVAMQSQVAAATKTLSGLEASKADLEKQITACTDQLKDEDVLRALADAMRISVADVDKPEKVRQRSPEEEKFLEDNSVTRILQDAVVRRTQEMQDTIASGREEKV